MWSSEFEQRAAAMRQQSERDRRTARRGHEHLRMAEATASTGVMERHFTVQELGAIWQLSPNSITRIFRDEPGVLKFGRDQPRRGHRSYMTLRMPESVVQRVYRRLVVR
jgi:hypothetical protein